MPQESYPKPSNTKPITKKKKHYYYDEPDETKESDSYITEIRRRSKKQKKRIIYEDEIDGIPYEPDSPTEEEQEEDDNYEFQNKHKGKQPKRLEKPKKLRYYKINKNVNFLYLYQL